MKSNKGSIDLVGTQFPQRLRELREQRHLSKNDLAEKADLSYRTIHDLENGRRDRILEKTLMLLAAALEVPADELLERRSNGDPVPAPRPHRWDRLVTVVGATLMLVVLTCFLGWRHSVSRAVWEVDGGVIVMKDAYLGAELWRLDTGGDNTMCDVAPWSDDDFLVADRRTIETGGALLCLERSSGKVRWEVRPDVAALIAAFGEEDVMAATMNCIRFQPADLDGNGEPEVVANFTHGLYYPSVLARVDRHGNLVSQYANKGHLYEMAVLDLDDDGKDEVLVAGTNNSKAYQGATLILLDDEHFSGAAVDSLTDAWSSEPDSARVRLVFPNYPEPYRSLVGAIRLTGFNLTIHHDLERNRRLNLSIAGGSRRSDCLVVTLDQQLNPVKIDITDGYLARINTEWPDSLTNGTGPGHPGWREQWLAQHRRFEAGHWPR